MNALAALETNSLALGYLLADEACKTADVELHEANSICAGKFLVLFSGTAAAVRSAVEAARRIVPEGLYVQQLYLARVHDDVLGALCGTPPPRGGALGSYESHSAIAALRWGDEVAKRCDVRLYEIRMGRGLGGKSTVTFGGDQAKVEAAAEWLRTEADPQGLLADVVVIARPGAAAMRATGPDGPGHACGAPCSQGGTT